MLFMLYPTLILIVLTCFLEQDRKLVFAIVMFSIIMLLGIIYLIIRREFVKDAQDAQPGEYLRIQANLHAETALDAVCSWIGRIKKIL